MNRKASPRVEQISGQRPTIAFWTTPPWTKPRTRQATDSKRNPLIFSTSFFELSVAVRIHGGVGRIGDDDWSRKGLALLACSSLRRATFVGRDARAIP
jgi:hypothetical protein